MLAEAPTPIQPMMNWLLRRLVSATKEEKTNELRTAK